MKNKLTDLNNLLFEQLERLNDDELTGTELEEQILKAAAIGQISSKIIAGASVQLKAIQVMDNASHAVASGKASEFLGFSQTEEVKLSDEQVFKDAYSKDKNSIQFIKKN